MIRFAAVISSLFLLVSNVSAQQVGRDACARDVSRFCRAYMSEGDQVVLACLKQHRARLSKACDKILTEHGQ
jgi:Cysteine rich repeat